MPYDRFGRDINYLRISLIDHCNLRCVYCMPLTGLQYTPGANLLRPAELETVVRAAMSVGFQRVRLTGGEPTLRSDLLEIVGRLAAIPGLNDLAMTTNGVLLAGMVDDLARVGLKRVNVHLDSLNHDRLTRVMRFGSLDRTWAGIEAAERAGLTPIKINCVVTRGFNDEDVVELARLTLERDWHVRFIELMPLGGGECANLSRERFVPSHETRSLIEEGLGELIECPNRNPSDESRNFRAVGARGIIGFISPVSAPYCGSCNRMRITADGRLHLCLLHDHESDLRPALRAGASIEELADLFIDAVQAKPTGHELERGVSTRIRSMYQVGG